MKRLIVLTTLLSSAFVLTAFAQPNPGCRGPKGCEMGPRHGRPAEMRQEMRHERRTEMMRMMHEDGTPVTVRGRVVSIEEGERGGQGGGKIVKVESDSKIVSVHMGPAWRRDGTGSEFNVNDRVEIEGMQITRGGQTHVMARPSFQDGGKGPLTERPMHKKQRMMRHHPKAY